MKLSHDLSALPHQISITAVLFIISMLLPATASAFYEINANGGQCNEIGIWDEPEATCTFTTDVDEQIIVTSPLVTVDGDGFTVDVTGESEPYAIRVDGQLGVTIRNTNLRGGGIYFNQADNGTAAFNQIETSLIGLNFFNQSNGRAEGNIIRGIGTNRVDTAFVAQNTADLTVVNNYITEAIRGIRLDTVEKSEVRGNRITAVSTGVVMGVAQDSVIADNYVSDTDTGLELNTDDSGDNQFFNNTFTRSAIGVRIVASDTGGPGGGPTPNFSQHIFDWLQQVLTPAVVWAQGIPSNEFFTNNFITNDEHVSLSDFAEVLFSRPSPVGGNYWDTYDEVSEGCADNNNDEWCDNLLELNTLGISDEQPRLIPAVTESGEPQCSDAIDNDADDLTDFPADLGCENADDWLEINPPLPTCVLTVEPNEITEGATTTLRWSSTGAAAGEINGEIGAVDAEGEITLSPNESTVYTGSFTNSGGSVSCEATVTVVADEPPELSLGEKAAAFATQLVNQPDGYLWGGKGWDFILGEFMPTATILSGYNYYNPDARAVQIGIGVDCSGLVAWAYNFANDATRSFLNNFIAYENAAGQASDAQSIAVTETELLPGDTLYFDFNLDGRIDHTAMYVGDQGEYDVVNSSRPETGIVPEDVALYSALSSFEFFRRPISAQVAMVVEASSPVDLTLTDPAGHQLSFRDVDGSSGLEYVREIPGELYYSETVQGHDGNPADVIYSPKVRDGQYLVAVTPSLNADPQDTYSLAFTAGDKTIMLAEDVPVEAIPSQGYGVMVAGNEIEVIEVEQDVDQLFLDLKEQVRNSDTKHRLFKRVLLLKVTLAEKFYERGKDTIAKRQLKHLIRLLERVSGKLIDEADANEIVVTSQLVIKKL